MEIILILFLTVAAMLIFLLILRTIVGVGDRIAGAVPSGPAAMDFSKGFFDGLHQTIDSVTPHPLDAISSWWNSLFSSSGSSPAPAAAPVPAYGSDPFTDGSYGGDSWGGGSTGSGW